jgi:lipopolysaccharide/colanic/teichoic acid biosynthesis glycosyltransferase
MIMTHLYWRSPASEGHYLENTDGAAAAAPTSTYGRIERRITDVITAAAGLLLLFPLLAATGLAILLDSASKGEQQ